MSVWGRGECKQCEKLSDLKKTHPSSSKCDIPVASAALKAIIIN